MKLSENSMVRVKVTILIFAGIIDIVQGRSKFCTQRYCHKVSVEFFYLNIALLNRYFALRSELMITEVFQSNDESEFL